MNKNNKIITNIFFIIFFIVFSIFNFDEYKNYHLEKENQEKEFKYIQEQNTNFNISDIKDLNDISFFYTPYKELLTDIVQKIDSSENKIYIEVYMLTESRIKDALIRAKNRWIDIKIILEKDPYMAYSINDKNFNILKKNNVDIRWSNDKNYSLNHTKILIIDDLSIISSWNLTYSTFTKNRDFFIFTKDENIRIKLEENFLNDFNWIKKNIYDDNLIFSPIDSREKIYNFLNWASNNIKMYFQYLKDDDFVNYLIKIKNEKNLNIEIILADTAKNDKNNKLLENNWIKISYLKSPKIHAKAILIDEKYLFIWSINISEYSLDKNREIWILLKNTEIIDKFVNIFKQDIKNSF